MLSSDIRRKRIRRIIRKLCEPANKHLVPIRSMPIRWNTTYAEIECGVKLKPAINRWIDQLDEHLTGQKKKATLYKKKKWHLSPGDWDFLEYFAVILVLFHSSTLDLLKKGVTTICKMLPLYKLVEQHLTSHLSRARKDFSSYGLNIAIGSGLRKLEYHLETALTSDYPLLGAVLHPALRLSYFEDTSLWSTKLDLPHCVVTPSTRNASTINMSPSKQSPFMSAIKTHGAANRAAQNEVKIYLSGLYPYAEIDDNPLAWWKQHSRTFPVLLHIARDILAIPAVSVSVEQLFSSSKHTLSDSRSSLTAESASLMVISKEWLKLGYGNRIDYL
ncbi:hypothetical protein PAXRUDRAFT_19762 [Paxillus rubicundulus Ve08.2h10]|uniref:HAT C-terminal dimerisation domain-containing protein n=1 Tax=Paxillus rubicundulus Ve08.2h10 TaxID=930991 RepID=A0A0D0BT04_9AGAM|nr:hypothetical protein PAXRUDRAFT_19762 [Paxillus rubicundulus Ve08.2h10]